ncbi:ImmA/IrrE family metallo-endopeptidase [Oerskovia sp. NPDC060338]|uniref:ImmA/IrrE family metallo-endopeptidase n=1 Tax=Oerskovia sp. NPDC060338 TaxID=3347100 RepID=UPI003666B31C
MRELLHHAHEQGVYVEWSRAMGENLRGVYEHDVRTVTINAWLNGEQARSTLAHELGHAWYGHTWTSAPHDDNEHERLANEWAAKFLIDAHAYATAEREVGPHPGALGAALNVTADLVVVFQRIVRRSANVHAIGFPRPWVANSYRKARGA